MRKFFTLSAALFCLAGFASAEILPAEKLLPDDTLLMFTIPDFTKIRDVYHNSPQGRLWNDPAMKDFKDKFISKLTADYITPMEHDLGVSFDDYTNLPQGQFTIAFVQNGWSGKEGELPGLLLLLDTKDKSPQLKTNLADLKRKWVDAGKTVKTEKIREVDFSVITLTSNDIPKTLKKPDAPLPPGVPPPLENPELKKEPKQPLYIGQVESLLIVGNSPKVIEKILARMSGGSVKTLGELSSFDSSAGLFRGSPAYGWVNAKAFVDVWGHPSADSSDADSASPLALKPDKIINALGLGGLSTVAFSYVYAQDGARFNLSVAAPEASRAGLLKVLAGEAKDYAPPPFVPADTVKFQRWRLDGQKTWVALRKMIGEIYPSAIGVLDFALSTAESGVKEKDPGFDIKKNIIGNLGDDIITYSKNPRGKTLAELNAPPAIFLIGSPNPEQLITSLKSLLDLSGPATGANAPREFLGHKIYTMSLPSPPQADGSPGPARSLSYASSGGYIALAMDTSLLEEYLRSSESQAKALRDLPGLSDAIQKVGGSGTSLFGYSNEAESMRVLFDALKQDPGAADPLSGAAPVTAAMGMGPMKVGDWFDVTLLPPFEKVSKYFYISVYSIGSTSDSLTFKAFAPTPPQYK